MKHLFVSGVAWVLLTAQSCDNGVNQEYTDLLHRAAELEQRHCRIQSSIDSLWDSTSAQLDRALPASFPTVDREIYLKARNADHIRMFMSFEKLDAGTQALVNATGQYDALLAAELRHLLEQKEAFEHQKNQFLQGVGKHNAGTSRAYADHLREVAAGRCQ